MSNHPRHRTSGPAWINASKESKHYARIRRLGRRLARAQAQR